MVGWLLVFYNLATAKVILGWIPTHGDFIMLSYWEIRHTDAVAHSITLS